MTSQIESWIIRNRFQNMRTRQKEPGILCWRLLRQTERQTDRQTDKFFDTIYRGIYYIDRQTNSLTPYMGYVDFSFSEICYLPTRFARRGIKEKHLKVFQITVLQNSRRTKINIWGCMPISKGPFQKSNKIFYMDNITTRHKSRGG